MTFTAALAADRVAARAKHGSRKANTISRVSTNLRGVAHLVLAATVALLCDGCLVGPDFSSPSAPVADKWLESHDPSVKSATLTAPGHPEDWAWWTVFHDPVLDRLMRIAYDQNLSLISAGTRVLQARA